MRRVRQGLQEALRPEEAQACPFGRGIAPHLRRLLQGFHQAGEPQATQAHPFRREAVRVRSVPQAVHPVRLFEDAHAAALKRDSLHMRRVRPGVQLQRL